MRFFELHFNPQKIDAPDLVFDSFCYEPENIYEKRLGSLFIVGELKNVFPQNLKFLDNLSAEIKRRYYSAPVKFSAEAALKDCLKKTNEFLEGVAKQGEVSWLGNLNLAILSFAPAKKDEFLVNFTKVGNVKILLVRSGEIIDIGKNLEFSEIEPYPLKIFGNIVSGKLAEKDVVAILTEEVFEHFSGRKILKEITKATQHDFGKVLKEVLQRREKELRKISGICLLCFLIKESWVEEKKPKTSFTFQKEAEKFSPAKLFRKYQKRVLSFNSGVILSFRRLDRKNVILVLLFLFLLLLGFLIFR